MLTFDFLRTRSMARKAFSGDAASEFQWVIDPIDGTVNYFYGIPHFAISIALRQAGRIIVGVIYDPMRDELVDGRGRRHADVEWAAHCGQRAQGTLPEAVVSVGVAKSIDSINRGLPLFERMLRSR